MSPAINFEPRGKFPPLIIPRLLARSKELPVISKLVYAALLSHRGNNGLSAPSIFTLASDTGLTVRQVRKHLTMLEAESYIARVEQPLDIERETYAFLPHFTLQESKPAQFPQADKLRQRLADLRANCGTLPS